MYEKIKRHGIPVSRVIRRALEEVRRREEEEARKALERARALLQRIPPEDIVEAVREAREGR